MLFCETCFSINKDPEIFQVHLSESKTDLLPPSSSSSPEKLSINLLTPDKTVSNNPSINLCSLSGLFVYSFNVSIDKRPTQIEESSPVVLRYKTPYFRASASVVIPPIDQKNTWTIGWIQACEKMEFKNTYGEHGHSSWEIPQLEAKKAKAVSDSDGVSYPWYGNSTEIATISGPTKNHKFIHVK